MNDIFLLESLPKHCCHWHSHLPPKLGPENMARHEVCLAQAQLSFLSWSLKKELPLHIPGQEDVSWGQPGQVNRDRGHLFWPRSVSATGHMLLPQPPTSHSTNELISESTLTGTPARLGSTCVCPSQAALSSC